MAKKSGMLPVKLKDSSLLKNNLLLILPLINFIIFTALGFLHFYWAIGGEYGFSVSLPTKENGERVLNPKKIDSAIVGLGLISFGAFYLLKTELIEYTLPNWITTYGGWIIPSIFLLRALGDFKYVGFFKQVTKTNFAYMDTKYFSPLCLIIGIIGLLIQM